MACFTLGISASAVAQKGETRPRQANQTVAVSSETDDLVPKDEAFVVSVAAPEDIKAATVLTTSSRSNFNFDQLMSAAIDERLGARYRWGAEGPTAFDCSGFVWSIFQAAGINFERISARGMWSRFAAPTEAEKYRFGTLVFFNNLAHVGVVVDERGFYHASRRNGVIYSPFNDYWRERLDGFRIVPNATAPISEIAGR